MGSSIHKQRLFIQSPPKKESQSRWNINVHVNTHLHLCDVALQLNSLKQYKKWALFIYDKQKNTSQKDTVFSRHNKDLCARCNTAEEKREAELIEIVSMY